MSAHQILTGALNRGDQVFSVGTVDGVNFTACAVGTNIVVLSPSFERIQVITPNSEVKGLLVNCVDACRETGKVSLGAVVLQIVATYGNVIRIYEPTTRTDDVSSGFQYCWIETHSLTFKSTVDKVLWNLQGLRLLICSGDVLHLYQHSLLSAALTTKLDAPVTFEIIDEENDEEAESGSSWDCIWSQKLAARLKFMSCSPDGAFFATCGASDCLVKIWFQREKGDAACNGVSFGFSYVQHPSSVIGFEWRKVPRCMSRQCVQNALLTWCEDNTVRIWKEATNIAGDFQIVSSTTEVFSFCLTQSDCLLVPSLGSEASFVVHWLNNKEVVYDIGVERLMFEALSTDRGVSIEPSDETESLGTSESRNFVEPLLQAQNSLTESLYRKKESNATAAEGGGSGGNGETDGGAVADILDELLASNLKDVSRVVSTSSTTVSPLLQKEY
ncbi:unnamed protein product [Gongylonema pulchrum]|uniref:WD_REPEATS_REGION domain-containing protein n=1 Tax=Gongylonema pulchrum TaxID=637853 RepID=A0A183E9R9_9BILA|nr:unnamed protein product [Gongylonema pulchrum]